MNVDDHLAQQMQDPEFRREWEAHEDCFEEQKRLTRYIVRYRRLRDGYKAQRNDGRELARELFAYALLYAPNPASPLHRELMYRAKLIPWLTTKKKSRPQEVAVDDD